MGSDMPDRSVADEEKGLAQLPPCQPADQKSLRSRIPA